MSENLRIVRAAGLISALTFCSRVTGLIRDAVIGYLFGTGPAADAFFVAFRLPNLLRRFAAEGAMGIAFVPIFSNYLGTARPAEAERALRALLGTVIAVLSAIVVVGIAAAPTWVRAFAPGFTDDPGLMGLTVGLTRLLLPYALLISVVALLGGYLNAAKHFFAPALSPLVLNLAIIGSALFLARRLDPAVAALAWGVVLGGVLQVTLQVVPLVRMGVRPVPDWQPRHPAVGRSFALLGPAVFGAAVYQVNILVSTILASILPAGSVSYLWYADRVFEFPLGLLAVALGTAALPSFAGQASRGAYDEMRGSVSFSLALANFLALPATAGLVCLATPITAVLFQRGAFGAEEVARTAAALRFFAVGLGAVSLVRILAPAFYALGDPRTPVRAASLALVANLVFSLMLIGRPTATGAGFAGFVAALARSLCVLDLRHGGLALATSLAAGLNASILAVALWRRLGGLRGAFVLGSLARSLAATVPMIPVLLAVSGSVDWSGADRLAVKAAGLAAAIGAGLAAFAATAWLLGGPEVDRLRALLRRFTDDEPVA